MHAIVECIKHLADTSALQPLLTAQLMMNQMGLVLLAQVVILFQKVSAARPINSMLELLVELFVLLLNIRILLQIIAIPILIQTVKLSTAIILSVLLAILDMCSRGIENDVIHKPQVLAMYFLQLAMTN